MKFTPDGGTVSVTLELVMTGATNVSPSGSTSSMRPTACMPRSARSLIHTVILTMSSGVPMRPSGTVAATRTWVVDL